MCIRDSAFNWTGETTGTWYQIVISRINSNMSCYINTQQIGTTQSNSTNYSVLTKFGNPPLRFARTSVSGGVLYYFNGRIPIARVYNGKGLTASEIQQNFNATRGRYGI